MDKHYASVGNYARLTLQFITAPLVGICCLYAWAAVCFLYLKYARSENEGKWRRFLQYHRDFFTFRAFSPSSSMVTWKDMKAAGSRAWGMFALPVILLGFKINLGNFLLANGCLFFGGLMMAYSWYGLRCMKLLGMETISTPDA